MVNAGDFQLMNLGRLWVRSITAFSILAFVYLAASRVGVAQAQDFSTAHEGTVLSEDGAYAGYDTILWRMRLSQTEATPSQDITIYIDLIVKRHFSIALSPIYAEILVDTGGLTDEPLVWSGNIEEIDSNQAATMYDYEGSGYISIDFRIPSEKDWNGYYTFQAKNPSQRWSPSNTVTLTVTGSHPPPPSTTGQSVILIGTIVVVIGGAILVSHVFGWWSLPALVGRFGASGAIKDILGQLLPHYKYVAHVDIISPRDMDAIHKYLTLTRNARGEVLKNLSPDKVKQILETLPKE